MILVASLLCVARLALPDLDEDRTALLRLLRDRGDPRELVRAREQAVRRVGAYDEAGVVDALLDAHALLEKDAVGVEQGREKQDSPSAESRQDLDALRVIQNAIEARLVALQSAAARAELLERVLGDDGMEYSLRVALTGAIRAIPAAAGERVRRSLGGSKVAELLVALRLAPAVEAPTDALVDAVAARLDHGDPFVREAAAAALARLAHPRGIAPLVRRLGAEKGRTQQRIAEALEVLTDVHLGLSASAWADWLAAEGGPWLAGERPLGRGEARVTAQPESGYYFDLPQDGSAILYLLDVSNSMKVRLEEGAAYADEKAPRRLDRAKAELTRALRALAPGTRFNVLAFADDLSLYEQRMVTAEPRNVERACAWVAALEPQLGTQTFDALERAFRVAGRGTRDRYYDTAVDTVFLLSDGRPTVKAVGPGRKFPPDRPELILAAVRRWNALGRVVIHCIALGADENLDFLERLAADHGGACKVFR